MNNLIIGLFIYLLLLIIWGIVCLIAYALSIVARKPIIIKTISGITQIIGYIFYLIFGIYLLYFGVQLFFLRQFLWLFFYILFGSALFGGLGNLLLMPFIAIPLFFSENVSKALKEDDFVKAEILDENDKVIGITEGSGVINRRLALYFIIDFLIHLLYIFSHPQSYKMIAWWDYLITPIFFMVQNILLFGIFVLLFNKIKHNAFFGRGKLTTLISIYKVDIIITIGMQILATIYLITFSFY